MLKAECIENVKWNTKCGIGNGIGIGIGIVIGIGMWMALRCGIVEMWKALQGM
jgi:hypothetical protein